MKCFADWGGRIMGGENTTFMKRIIWDIRNLTFSMPIYVGGLISFAPTIIFLITLDISGKNRFCVGCMVSLFHKTSPWTHAHNPHPLHIEIEEFPDVRFKQRAVIEFLTAEKFPPIEIHRWMPVVYGDQCVDVSTVRLASRFVQFTCHWNTFIGLFLIILKTRLWSNYVSGAMGATCIF